MLFSKALPIYLVDMAHIKGLQAYFEK